MQKLHEVDTQTGSWDNKQVYFCLKFDAIWNEVKCSKFYCSVKWSSMDCRQHPKCHKCVNWSSLSASLKFDSLVMFSCENIRHRCLLWAFSSHCTDTTFLTPKLYSSRKCLLYPSKISCFKFPGQLRNPKNQTDLTGNPVYWLQK